MSFSICDIGIYLCPSHMMGLNASPRWGQRQLFPNVYNSKHHTHWCCAGMNASIRMHVYTQFQTIEIDAMSRQFIFAWTVVFTFLQFFSAPNNPQKKLYCSVSCKQIWHHIRNFLCFHTPEHHPFHCLFSPTFLKGTCTQSTQIK